MTAVLFVHGTGGREPLFSETLHTIERAIHRVRPDIQVMPCSWGEMYGARLHDNGASIPFYDTTRSLTSTLVEEEALEIALWEQLYKDPLYELRLLSLMSGDVTRYVPGQLRPGDILDERVRSLKPSNTLQAKLHEAGIATIFDQARLTITNSRPYDEALQGITQSLSEYQMVTARAIVAEAIADCEQQGRYAAILVDASLRDEVIALLHAELGDSERSIGGWLAKQLSGLVMAAGVTGHVQRRRGALTDAVSPVAGDILLYQGHGSSIRTFMRNCIHQATQPVVLLAHSLGGIACVDLLAEESLPEVRLLITVGSQAPFFYEIDALYSLRYTPHHENRLPAHFPPWLNIYDLRDFLSYIGASLFPERVRDIRVDNRQPFPKSHSAYWNNQATWNAILPELP